MTRKRNIIEEKTKLCCVACQFVKNCPNRCMLIKDKECKGGVHIKCIECSSFIGAKSAGRKEMTQKRKTISWCVQREHPLHEKSIYYVWELENGVFKRTLCASNSKPKIERIIRKLESGEITSEKAKELGD